LLILQSKKGNYVKRTPIQLAVSMEIKIDSKPYGKKEPLRVLATQQYCLPNGVCFFRNPVDFYL